MEPILTSAPGVDDESEAVAADQLLVHAWRMEQLGRLGLPRILAESFADRVDWHAIASLVERGCSPVLALEIIR